MPEAEIPPTAAGQRLDAYLGKHHPEQSRSQWKAHIQDGVLTVNNQRVKARHSLNPGDILRWQIPEQKPLQVQPQPIPLTILHEDQSLILLDKQPGLVVHPADTTPDGTLVNALLHHTQATNSRLSSIGAPLRPGIVHRLDRDTSGVLAVAKTDRAHQHLADQFASRKTTLKLYLGIVQGKPTQPSGTIHTNIGRHPVQRQKMAVLEPGTGKPALTDYRVITTLPQRREHPESSLVLFHLHTGRTHQIRVHSQHLGHPLLGDPIYAKPSRQGWQKRLMLHAWHLRLNHPDTNQPHSQTAPIPDAFQPWTQGQNMSQLLQLASAD